LSARLNDVDWSGTLTKSFGDMRSARGIPASDVIVVETLSRSTCDRNGVDRPDISLTCLSVMPRRRRSAPIRLPTSIVPALSMDFGNYAGFRDLRK
jgi:hypothetical protein